MIIAYGKARGIRVIPEFDTPVSLLHLYADILCSYTVHHCLVVLATFIFPPFLTRWYNRVTQGLGGKDSLTYSPLVTMVTNLMGVYLVCSSFIAGLSVCCLLFSLSLFLFLLLVSAAPLVPSIQYLARRGIF